VFAYLFSSASQPHHQYDKTPLMIATARERHGIVGIIERTKKRRKEEADSASKIARRVAAGR
jgi:hypothetical protein